jgi:hypothetical protein
MSWRKILIGRRKFTTKNFIDWRKILIGRRKSSRRILSLEDQVARGEMEIRDKIQDRDEEFYRLEKDPHWSPKIITKNFIARRPSS